MKDRVIAVFGLGAFGNEVCRFLSENGAQVLAFDNQPKAIEKIKDMVSQAFLIDSTDEESLTGAPLEDVDVAVIAIGDDMEASILTTAILKKIGIPYLLARAVSEIHMRVLKQVGADEVVNLEIEEGRLVASRLLTQDLLERIPLSKDYCIAEVYAPEDFHGKPIKSFMQKSHVNVVAVKQVDVSIDSLGNPNRNEAVRLPNEADIIREKDILLVVGSNDSVDELRED
jgi:trk system potassium uptake protein TrkA